MLEQTGIPNQAQIEAAHPDASYLIKPKAVLECFEEIPCNPCETSCPVGAITIGDDINRRPVLDPALCTGCGQCVHSCPGLAIHVVSVNDGKALFKIPYEMPDVPKPGDVWDGIGRDGRRVCDARILSIAEKPAYGKTKVLHVETSRDHVYDFITVRRP